MSFLTAEWRKLAILNYEIDPAILRKYIPYKTELDFFNGKCLVSLVGFMFLNTRLLGFSIPYHRNFEEVNLRFYVRNKQINQWHRGVVFIQEIVPKHAITLIANSIYREHYQTLPMTHSWVQSKDQRIIQYGWELLGNTYSFSLETELSSSQIKPDSEESFITEHYWGYTNVNERLTYAYEVKHPVWESYRVHNGTVDVDFKAVYGQEFSNLNNQQPVSMILAEGSKIAVEQRKRI